MGITTPIAILASAGLGFAGSLATSLVGNKYQQEADDRNYRRQIELWDKQNEYNKPVNQMARLEEAGLNPNLMYGQISAGNATQPGYTGSGVAKFDLNSNALMKMMSALDPAYKLKYEQAQEDLKSRQLNNDILKLREEQISHDLAFARFNNLPTNSPWYAKYIMDMLRSNEGLFYTLGNRFYDYTHWDTNLPSYEEMQRKAYKDLGYK